MLLLAVAFLAALGAGRQCASGGVSRRPRPVLHGRRNEVAGYRLLVQLLRAYVPPGSCRYSETPVLSVRPRSRTPGRVSVFADQP